MVIPVEVVIDLRSANGPKSQQWCCTAWRRSGNRRRGPQKACDSEPSCFRSVDRTIVVKLQRQLPSIPTPFPERACPFSPV